MQRFWKHLRIGRYWLKCGWRLFMRNPWLLGGMGFSTAILISVLTLIPLLGGLLIALLAPILLASAYLSLDLVYHQKLALPVSLRLSALKQSPRLLVAVFQNEARTIPTAVACAYSIVVVVLINLLARLLAGNAWVANWASLDWVSLLGVLAVTLLAFALYVVLAASLIYSLPLTFLRDEPLIPSIRRSFKASRHFLFALLVLLGLLLTPFILSALVSNLSPWISHLVWYVVGSVILPVVAASLYCSYRDIFAIKEASHLPENR